VQLYTNAPLGTYTKLYHATFRMMSEQRSHCMSRLRLVYLLVPNLIVIRQVMSRAKRVLTGHLLAAMRLLYALVRRKNSTIAHVNGLSTSHEKHGTNARVTQDRLE
jgi:hypothetical protein